MANPVFSREPSFQQGTTLNGQPTQRTSQTPTIGAPGLEQQFNNPSADPMAMGRMTYEGTILKALGFFILAIASALAVATFAPQLYVGAFIGAIALSLVVAFTRAASPVLMASALALYAGGAGGVSVYYEAAYGGIVSQALIATACVFAACLALYSSGKVRMSPKFTRYLFIVGAGYFIFAIVSFGISLAGGGSLRDAAIPGTGIPFGIPIGIFAVLLASFFLIRDFQFVQNGVERGAPAKHEWLAAYGIVFTLVWLYLEILRLLSYLRGR